MCTATQCRCLTCMIQSTNRYKPLTQSNNRLHRDGALCSEQLYTTWYHLGGALYWSMIHAKLHMKGQNNNAQTAVPFKQGQHICNAMHSLEPQVPEARQSARLHGALTHVHHHRVPGATGIYMRFTYARHHPGSLQSSAALAKPQHKGVWQRPPWAHHNFQWLQACYFVGTKISVRLTQSTTVVH